MRGHAGRRSIATMLIWVNVAVYILCALTAGPRHHVGSSLIFQFGQMTTQDVLHGQIWRLITSDYLHWSTGHIFMNMLGLYFLGRPLEQVWGARKFFVVYSISGILGSLFYMVLSLVDWLEPGIAAGASGCVLGLLGAAAVLFPNAQVYIYFLFPVKIRIVAVIFAGFYILNIWQTGQNAGGDACHLAGLAFGVWYAMKGDRWWMLKGHRLWTSLPRPSSRNDPSRPPTFKRDMSPPVDDATVDRILAKVRHSGITSLTEKEKRTLAKATERQRHQKGPFARGDPW